MSRWCWVVIWLMGTGLALAAPLQPGDSARIDVRPGSQANVRGGPGLGHPVLTRLARDRQVRVEAVVRQGRHDWARVVLDDGRSGWIRADLLAPVADVPATAPAAVTAPTAETGPSAPPPPWLAALRRHLRAVDICLEATTRRPAAVLRVEELPFEMVSVVVRDGSGRLWDCVVERGGGAPLRYDPLPPADVLFAREPDPVFYRSDVPDDRRCHRTLAVRTDTDGRIVGTLVYRTNCR